MARVSVAVGDTTAVPYLAMVVGDDGRSFRLVDVEGEVGGAADVIGSMMDLFGVEGDLFEVFGLYAAAYGMSASDPMVVEGSVASVAGWMPAQLGLGQGVGSAARSSMLQGVAAARRAVAGADSLYGVDAGAWDEDYGADGAWLPEVREAFLSAAGWEAYPLALPEGELAAALRERLVALGEPGPDEAGDADGADVDDADGADVDEAGEAGDGSEGGPAGNEGEGS